MKISGTKKYTLIALFVMFLWGSLFPLVKLGYKAFEIDTSSVASILTFAGLRFTVCGAIILLICLLTKKKMKISIKKEFPSIALVGLFSIILHYTFTYVGLAHCESGKTALLKQLAVVLFIPFSFIFYKNEHFKLRNLISAVLCLAGIIVLNINEVGFSFGIGELLVVSASVCTVVYNMLGKNVMKTVDPVVMTGYSQIFGGAVLLIAGIATGGKITSFSLYALGIFAYICFASILSYCLWHYVVKCGNLSSLFVIKFAEPVFAALIGALLLGENPFKITFLVALVLIAAAIINIQYSKQ